MSEVEPQRPDLNALLVFDGECGFCRRSVRWIQRTLPRQPRIEPWQSLDLDRWGLTARQCHDAVQWVEPRRTEAGARAIGRLLLAQGGVWRLLGWPPFVWPFSSAAEGLYRWVSRNRHRFKGDDG
jgi:predicted DCC family thiol-disulfide oxidoreductase YuxK